MYNAPNNPSTNNDVVRRISPDVLRQRDRNEDTAHRMVLLAVRQWERAIGGLIAIPSAIAVSSAAGAMLVSSLIERSFEILERTASDVGRRVGEDFDAHGDPRINVRSFDDRRPDA
jgi:hypothetical protein